MARFFERTLLVLVMSFSMFAIGCETTDYEPLIMKKKLQELEERVEKIESLQGGTSEAMETEDSSEENSTDSSSLNSSKKNNEVA